MGGILYISCTTGWEKCRFRGWGKYRISGMGSLLSVQLGLYLRFTFDEASGH